MKFDDFIAQYLKITISNNVVQLILLAKSEYKAAVVIWSKSGRVWALIALKIVRPLF